MSQITRTIRRVGMNERPNDGRTALARMIFMPIGAVAVDLTKVLELEGLVEPRGELLPIESISMGVRPDRVVGDDDRDTSEYPRVRVHAPKDDRDTGEYPRVRCMSLGARPDRPGELNEGMVRFMGNRPDKP